MARPATNPEARLQRLEVARTKVKALKRGTVLTASPMAEILGVRWPALRDWCDEIPGFATSGAFAPGGNGVEYQFKPLQTVEFLIRHFKSVIERQAKESRRLTDAIGVKLPDAESAPSMAETKDLVNLTLAVVAAQEKQGYFTPSHEVAEFIDGYNEAVVGGILGVRTKVDPNGNLPPKVRKAVDEHLRSVAANVHALAERYVGTRRAGLQQERTG